MKKSGKWGRDRTLAHVLDVSQLGSELSFTKDGKIDISSVRSYLEAQLSVIRDPEECYISGSSHRDGVFINAAPFGKETVAMDSGSACGDIKFDMNFLHLESQTIFSSVRANACVWKGRWMYEATLGTAGIQQLGWATISCPFTNEEGVGDAADSYAYDGRRVRKWSKCHASYGQPWVVGDVIGCCLDLNKKQIIFYRNGICLGVAYDNIRGLEPREGYYPAISLSLGERCELNFGGRPFKYPVEGFASIQLPPIVQISDNKHGMILSSTRAKFLLGCLQRLVQLGSREVAAAMAPEDRLRRYSRLTGYDVLSLGSEICDFLLPLLLVSPRSDDLVLLENNLKVPGEYTIWCSLVPFLLETYRKEAPHDASSVDQALDILLPRLERHVPVGDFVTTIMEALAYGCRTSPFTLVDHPYTGPYPYLALACHLLERYDFMVSWWMSVGFDSCLEGLLTRKGPNKNDLEGLLPIVWWPGSREDLCSEGKMKHAATSLSKAIVKVEDLQWELCTRLLHFVPPPAADLSQPVPGVVFRRFLRNLVCKNRGANRSIAPAGLSDNSVLVSTYCVLLRLLSEGFGPGKMNGDFAEGMKEQDYSTSLLHRVGKRSFPVSIFLKDSGATDFARLGGTFSHLVKTFPVGLDVSEVEWEESCMDEGDNVVRHDGKLKPACCSDLTLSGLLSDSKTPVRAPSKLVAVSAAAGVSERAGSPISSNYTSGRSCDGCVEDKPSSSGRVDIGLGGAPVSRSYKRQGFKPMKELSESIREEELLDIMLLLYHLGLAQNFKQASFFMQHQMQSIAQLDETDRQIREEKMSSEYVKRLKEARTLYREDLIDCVRQCTWYRVTMFARWKLRGMYATCMWLVQLLLVLSKRDPLFSYVPEFYVETLMDSFHALRRSDPPFVSPSSLLQQGLSPLVTFLVTHFNDVRIANPDVRDILLQSISVLVQYKEHVIAFERSQAARECMAGSLLSSFDNRFWIPVSNILLRLCKGSGFGASKCLSHGESFSPHFQRLLKEKCMTDERLFASFLNRLFNTLNWTITEFSVAIKEMQEQSDLRQVPDLLQRKCTIMFELSCNLERILEFLTQELPYAFLRGPEINLLRLCEIIVFVLNHTTISADAHFFDSTVRQQGQSPEKINRAMILAPLVGIILNLRNATSTPNHVMAYDVATVLAGLDVSAAVIAKFQYLIDYSWMAFKGDISISRISDLKQFVSKLKLESKAARKQTSSHDLLAMSSTSDLLGSLAMMDREEACTICYACEVDTIFFPCKHKSCQRCISRHLLNNQRCFFCNSTIIKFSPIQATPAVEDD
uniref:RING-type E3 ubiquitin transferase n=1 Tax=Physcomitrium patens TaxID=3218 RepID=A0A7I4BXX7_PHYPA